MSFPWAFYILLAQYDGEPFGSFPRWAIPLIISVVGSAGNFLFLNFGKLLIFSVVFLTTFRRKLDDPPPYYFLMPILSFLTCVLWIFVEANEVVGLLTTLGVLWNIDNVVMGLTFLAWANSVGDFVADTSLARIGRARTAVSYRLRK